MPRPKRTPLTRKTPLKRTAAKTDEPKKRYAFVVCPCCDNNYSDGRCHLCSGSGKVKAEFLRMAPGSARTRGAVKYKPGDKDWSFAVRERDGWRCRWCGKQHTPWLSESEGRLVCNTLDAAHLFRRRHGTTKQDLANGFAACKMTCHTYMDTHREEFHAWARAELGDAVYEDLEARSKETQKRVKRAEA